MSPSSSGRLEDEARFRPWIFKWGRFNSPDIIEEMLEFPPPTRFQRRNSTLNANIDLENVAESRNKTEEPNKASKMYTVYHEIGFARLEIKFRGEKTLPLQEISQKFGE